MSRCEIGIAEIVADWNTWYQERLWADEFSHGHWFHDTNEFLRETFKDTKAVELVPDWFPEQPSRIDPAAVTRPRLFKMAIRPTAIEIRQWSLEITRFAVRVHKELHACSASHDLLLRLVLDTHKAPSKEPSTGESDHNVVCGHHLNWFVAFNEWGQALAYWEDAVARSCKLWPDPSGKLAIRQISRPPWPPWGT